MDVHTCLVFQALRKAVALLRAEQEEAQEAQPAAAATDHPGPKSSGLPRKKKRLG